jgi:hypothetical protein
MSSSPLNTDKDAMINYLRAFAMRRLAAVKERVDRLTKSVDLAERNMDALAASLAAPERLDRILTCRNQSVRVAGTEAQIRSTAEVISQRLGGCVTISVVVGYYHRRACKHADAGAVETLGN